MSHFSGRTSVINQKKKKKVLDALHSLIQLARRAIFFNRVNVQVLRAFCKFFSFALSISYVDSLLVGMSSLFSWWTVFMTNWNSVRYMRIYFFNAAFEVWALVVVILEEGGESLSASENKLLEGALWPCLKNGDGRNVLNIYLIQTEVVKSVTVQLS